jgi:DNA-binding MarR family transcriptional regulator
MDEDEIREDLPDISEVDYYDINEPPTLTEEEVEYLFEEYLENEFKDIREFFKKKGSMQLLALAKHRQFSEILSEIDISRPTLAKRLDEAQDMELLQDRRITKDGKRVTIYEFTKKSRSILHFMDVCGFIRTFERYREVKRTLKLHQIRFEQFISDDQRLANLLLDMDDEAIQEIKEDYRQNKDSESS